MKWSTNIVQYDKSASKNSSRSLSKFKKVNLIKTEEESQESHVLEKSLMKLDSTQKIKPVNRSFANSYLANRNKNSSKDSNHYQNHDVTVNNQQQDKSHYIEEEKINTQKNNQDPNSKSLQNLFFNNNHEDTNLRLNQKQQSSNYDKNRIGKSSNPKSILSSSKQFPYNQSSKMDKKFAYLLKNMNYLINQFKVLCINIKKQLNKTIQNSMDQFKTDLGIFLKEYTMKLQMGVGSLIDFNTQNITEESTNKFFNQKRRFQTSSRQSQSFSAVQMKSQAPLEQEQSFNQVKVQGNLRKPQNFKNKFKQLLGNNNNQKDSQTTIQNIRQNNKQSKPHYNKQFLKIQRKRTSPAPRVNSFLHKDKDDSCDPLHLFNNNQHNDSTNSIRYRKVADRSASKQVKRLQQKVVSLKNILNLNNKQQLTNSQFGANEEKDISMVQINIQQVDP